MNNIEEYKISLTQEQSVELFKNTLNKFEIRGEGLCLLKIAIKNVLSEREADKKRIKELEEENKKYTIKLTDEEYRRVIEIAQEDIKKQFEQKVKDVLIEIREEYDKAQEQFDIIWDKKSKDNHDRYKLQELSAMQQELGFILGKLELLEDK